MENGVELVGVVGGLYASVCLVSGQDIPLLPKNHKFLVKLSLYLLEFALKIGIDPQNAIETLPDLVIAFLGTLLEQLIKFIKFQLNLVDLGLIGLQIDLQPLSLFSSLNDGDIDFFRYLHIALDNPSQLMLDIL